MKLWIIFLVLFNIKLSIAYVYCDSRAMLRRRTYTEMILCQRGNNTRSYSNNYDYGEDDNDDDDYYFGRSYNRRKSICNSYISDYSESTTCTAHSLEIKDSLKIEGPSLLLIKFKNSSIGTIPSNFFKDHPLLTTIYLDNSHISDIHKDAFKGAENLRTLYLGNNNITEIKNGVFNSLKNLTKLDISCNQIKKIEESSFKGLFHLQTLNVSHNQIQHISEDMFESKLNSLHTLDLSHNIISTVDLQTISNLQNDYIEDDWLTIEREIVDLSFNNLTSFDFSQITVNLSELNLANNNLETLDGMLNSKIINILDLNNNLLSKFSYAPKNIEYLDLSDNILQDLNISFPNVSTIRTLDVSQNLIEKLLPNTFDNMLNLTSFYIKNNKLTSLPIGLFSKLQKLQILNLSGNKLKRIEFGTFSGLSALYGLDLSGNLFTTLDYKTFHIFSELLVLNIENNSLTTLNPYDLTVHCKDLHTIRIGGNPWNCESLLNFTTVLKSNHVTVIEGSHNYIQNHLGHPCYASDETTENPSKRVMAIGDGHLENKINDLTKLFETDFRNSKQYVENLQNLTSTLNLLNLKLSGAEQTDLTNPVLSRIHKLLDKSFNNLNAMNKSTVDLLNTNLENFSKSVHNITNYFENESSYYKLFRKRFENGSSDQANLNEVLKRNPKALNSNNAYPEMASVSDKNQDIAQQMASLRSSFIAFMSILITILLIAMLLPVFKRFVNMYTRKSEANNAYESTTDIPLI